jgi:hypothetical protein
MFEEKTRGQKSLETVSLRSEEYEISAQEGRRGDGRGRVLYLVWKTPRKHDAP